jgi:hypothetical protein
LGLSSAKTFPLFFFFFKTLVAKKQNLVLIFQRVFLGKKKKPLN